MLSSIKTKMLTFKIGLVVLAIGALGISSYILMARFVNQSQQMLLENIASSQADRLQASIDVYRARLEKIAMDKVVDYYIEKYNELLLLELFNKNIAQFDCPYSRYYRVRATGQEHNRADPEIDNRRRPDSRRRFITPDKYRVE